MINSKILILLLSSFKYPSPRNELIQKKTWIKEAESNGIKVVNFTGNSNKLTFNYPNLNLTSGDSIKEVGYKTLEAFEWSEENISYDYIFRVNSSSYVDTPRLIKFINNLNQEFVYAGSIKNIKMLDLKFISGSGVLFNKNAIKKILVHKDEWDHDLIDDVALGKLCKKIDIPTTEGEFFEINSNILNYNSIPESYHIRCKLEDYGYPRFLESYNMKILYKLKNNYDLNLFTKWFYQITFKFFKFINLKHYFNKYFFRNRNLRNKIRKYKNIIIGK